MIVWEKPLEKNEAMKTVSFNDSPIGVYWVELESESGFEI